MEDPGRDPNILTSEYLENMLFSNDTTRYYTIEEFNNNR